METTADDHEEARFTLLQNPPKWAFNDSFVVSNLQKWDLQKDAQVMRFRYTKRYHRLAADEFLVDLFNSEEVQKHFQVKGEDGALTNSQKVSAVRCEILPSDLISLDFFDRLETSDPPIVRGEGHITKCLETNVNGLPISDMLRDALANEESENADLYSEDERKQFMFQLLTHLSFGGPMCQYEEELDPYTETLKRIYKSLLCVHKNAATGQIEVTSVVYKVHAVESDTWSLFPKDHKQNFCYVAVDVLRRQCTIWYYAYQSYW